MPRWRKWRRHRLPRAAGGDAHLLVVVARASRPTRTRRRARSRARPRSRWRCRRTWRCPCRPRRRGTGRRRRSARPAAAATTAPSTRLSVTSSSAADEQPVARLDLGARAASRSAGGRFTTKPPLAPRRHDHRVLHLLRLHQAEDLGAEVFAAVRPADAAARDAARRAGARLRRAASTRRSRTAGGAAAGRGLRAGRA